MRSLITWIISTSPIAISVYFTPPLSLHSTHLNSPELCTLWPLLFGFGGHGPHLVSGTQGKNFYKPQLKPLHPRSPLHFCFLCQLIYLQFSLPALYSKLVITLITEHRVHGFESSTSQGSGDRHCTLLLCYSLFCMEQDQWPFASSSIS